MEREQSFQQVVLEQLDIHIQKMSLDCVSFTKINSKQITDLNVKHNKIKTPRL